MSMTLELVIFSGIFVLAVGLVVSLIGSTDNRKRKLIAWQESRRLAKQPRDMDRNNRRGNR